MPFTVFNKYVTAALTSFSELSARIISKSSDVTMSWAQHKPVKEYAAASIRVRVLFIGERDIDKMNSAAAFH